MGTSLFRQVHTRPLSGRTTPVRVELQSVPNASNVQIHTGNTAADVNGCFAIGKTASPNAVGQSVAAMNAVNAIVSADGGNITVTVAGNATAL